MENKKDYEIKMDGKEHKFGEATRYTKDGKGRFDLIPEDAIISIIARLQSDELGDTISGSIANAVISALSGEYDIAIIYMMATYYFENTVSLSPFSILNGGLPQMLQDLAIHFQKGAEKYGERNCEKGIPLWSFRDSGLRHLCQWLMGNRDENHFIAAVWNFVMAIWTIKNHPERCGDKPEEIQEDEMDKKEDINKHEAGHREIINNIDELLGILFGDI